MAKLGIKTVGVDVSPGMIKLARARAAELGIKNVAFQSQIPDFAADWVNTFIVLQHIQPRRGYEIIAKLLDSVSVDGALSLHVTFYKDRNYPVDPLAGTQFYSFNGEASSMFSDSTSPSGAMMMFDYDMNKVLQMLYTRGFYEPIVQHVVHGGCHGARMFCRKFPT